MKLIVGSAVCVSLLVLTHGTGSVSSDHGETTHSLPTALTNQGWLHGHQQDNASLTQQGSFQQTRWVPDIKPPRSSSAVPHIRRGSPRSLVQTAPSRFPNKRVGFFIPELTAARSPRRQHVKTRHQRSSDLSTSSHASKRSSMKARYLGTASPDLSTSLHASKRSSMKARYLGTASREKPSMENVLHTEYTLIPQSHFPIQNNRSDWDRASTYVSTRETESSQHMNAATEVFNANTRSALIWTTKSPLQNNSSNGNMAATSVSTQEQKSYEKRNTATEVFNAKTNSASHWTYESPVVASLDDSAKDSFVLGNAEIRRCLLAGSEPLHLSSHTVIVDLQNLNITDTMLNKCQVLVTPPAGQPMSVNVTNVDCNLTYMYYFAVKQNNMEWPIMSANEYCGQLDNAIFTSPNASVLFTLSFREPMEGVHLFLNLTTVEVSRILTVEYTSRMNGSVSSPGWDGATSFLMKMDTWVSVAIPVGHEVMVSVFHLDLKMLRSNVECEYYNFLALHDDLDEDPLHVYCTNGRPAPVAFNSSSGNLVVAFLIRSFPITSTGFKLHFSFHPPSTILAQLADGGLWNCSTPHWSQFQYHFPCNHHAECAGAEDEAPCPYTTAHCGGAGRLDLAGFCYVHIPAKREETESPLMMPTMSWNTAEERCRRVGGHLASLNSYREKQAVTDFSRHVRPDTFFFIGLVPTGSTYPLLYQNLWTYLDGTVAHYAGPGVEGDSSSSEHLDLGNHEKDSGHMLFGVITTINRHTPLRHASALCETTEAVDSQNTQALDRGGQDDLLPSVNLTFQHMDIVVCPLGHRTHAFLACDVHSACWARAFGTSASCTAPLTPLPPSMTCDDALQTVPYSLVCDGRPDCSDRSDEDFCFFEPCDITKELRCSDKTCHSVEGRCDAIHDCIDASDERNCENRFFGETTLVPPPPAVLNFDGRGGITFDFGENLTNEEANRTATSHQPVCPDTHFQCAPNDYCVPVFTRCNDVYDCPGHEDEAGCDSYTCPGFYRCRGSRICLHEDDLCDLVFHCPQGDDEQFCNLDCPYGCTCYGLAAVCPSVIQVDLDPELRYLDAGNSGMGLSDVKNNSWLVYLSLVHCGVSDWDDLFLPNLRSLDLAHNNLTIIPALVLQQLPHLRHLTLAHNPLTSFVSRGLTPFSVSFSSLRSLDVSGVLLIDVNALKIFPQLHVLNLTGCGINRLHRDGFQQLSRLRVLDVRRCPLAFFPRAVFQGLDDLTAVYADNYKLCCPATLPEGFNPVNCQAPINEVSSCESLLGSIGFRICLCAFAVLACAGNTFSLIVRMVSSKSKFKTGFDIFVATLCVSDFLMGVYLSVIGVADFIYLGTYLWEDMTWRQSTACRVAGFISLLSNEVSAFIISLITLDRFLVLRFPFRQLRFTRSTALLASGMAWVMGLAIATVPLLPWTSHWEFYSRVAICIPLPITRQDFGGSDYAFSVMIVLNFVLFVFIAGGQFFVYMSVQTHKMPTNTNTTATLNKDRKLARRLIAVATSDFLCWFPIGLMAIMAKNGFPIPGQVNVAMAVFVMPLNSAINPFLYTLNIVIEKHRRLQEKRLQQWMLSHVQLQSAHGGSSVLSVDKCSKEKAQSQLNQWLKRGVLSREHVLECLDEKSYVATSHEVTLDDRHL